MFIVSILTESTVVLRNKSSNTDYLAGSMNFLKNNRILAKRGFYYHE